MTLPPAPVLLVFARAPVVGRCKTRLIPRYGARKAAAWHAALVHHTLQHAIATGVPVQLWAEPTAGHAFFLACRRRYAVSLHRQSRGDLGRKMSRALDAQVRRGHTAVLVGTDCPVLDAAGLRHALAALATHDAVLRPAEDGGYVLLGTRRNLGSSLRAVAWSSGREYRQTQQRLQARGFRCAELAKAWDIDTPAGLRRARKLALLPPPVGL